MIIVIDTIYVDHMHIYIKICYTHITLILTEPYIVSILLLHHVHTSHRPLKCLIQIQIVEGDVQRDLVGHRLSHGYGYRGTKREREV